MKKALKILSLVLVFVLALAPVVALADTPFTATAQNVDGLDKIKGPVGQIVQILQWAGYSIAVVMVLWLGIQWMLAQPTKKAELKGKMWSIAIGIVLLVGGVTILGIVWNMAESAQLKG